MSAGARFCGCLGPLDTEVDTEVDVEIDVDVEVVTRGARTIDACGAAARTEVLP